MKRMKKILFKLQLVPKLPTRRKAALSSSICKSEENLLLEMQDHELHLSEAQVPSGSVIVSE